MPRGRMGFSSCAGENRMRRGRTRCPATPVVPWVFVLFATVYLVLTVYNDVAGYRAAVAAGQPALINSAFGIALVLVGAPIYLFYRRRGESASPAPPAAKA